MTALDEAFTKSHPVQLLLMYDSVCLCVCVPDLFLPLIFITVLSAWLWLH